MVQMAAVRVQKGEEKSWIKDTYIGERRRDMPLFSAHLFSFKTSQSCHFCQHSLIVKDTANLGYLYE